ncbi:MAG: RHS repeat protein [Bryobacterales bacterium]|nr:RHS repeat protein [Bryobacterales bacterium]
MWSLSRVAGVALGQVTKTIEPNPDGGADYETPYSYQVSGALSQVSITRAGVTQVRSWSYNATTPRLESETHPDTGTTMYTYNADGIPLRMTRANGKQFSYSYDALGRVSQVSDNGQGDDCVKQVYSYDTGSENEMGRPSSVQVRFGMIDYMVGGLVNYNIYAQPVAGGGGSGSAPASDHRSGPRPASGLVARRKADRLHPPRPGLQGCTGGSGRRWRGAARH